MKIRGMVIAAQAFGRARWRAHALRSRAAIDAYQARALHALVTGVLPQFPYYAARMPLDFATLPVVDKAELTANFQLMNRAGLSADMLRAALAEGEQRLAGRIIGHSTGTSGNRGYYVISDAERFVWLGTLLAKALPDALWRRHRVALALPGLSDLYASARGGSRITLGFFDLAQGVGAWRERLRAFGADTIVAPPKVLRALAEDGALTAQHIFSAAEVLDPIDRAVISAATGRVVREIYMATEGLLGVSCAHGTMHLAEDVVHFGWLPVAGDEGLKNPVITDFTRREQALVRYRMNDLLRLRDAPCPCGSAYAMVESIAGRQDDICLIDGDDGAAIAVTPDVLRNAIVDAHPAITDFRVVQTGPCQIEIALPHDVPAEADAAVAALLRQRLALLGVVVADIVITRGITTPFTHKLRRVQRSWPPRTVPS